MGKVIEKLAANLIAEHCELTGVLHPGQMGGRRGRSAIDAAGCLVQQVQQGWGQKQLTGALFMDIKGAFPHVHPGKLVEALVAAGLDNDLTCWVQSFIQGQQICFLIDSHLGSKIPINSGLP